MSLIEFQEEIQPYFIPLKFKKKAFLLEKGQVCDFTFFITKGATTMYIKDEFEDTQFLAFGFEEYWITDRQSYKLDNPSIMNIQTLEATEGLKITKTAFENIFENNKFFRQMIIDIKESNAIATYERVSSFKIKSAEKRYHDLVKKSPHIIKRVPLHMIASYLGIKPETLSRLRKQPKLKK